MLRGINDLEIYVEVEWLAVRLADLEPETCKDFAKTDNVLY